MFSKPGKSPDFNHGLLGQNLAHVPVSRTTIENWGDAGLIHRIRVRLHG